MKDIMDSLKKNLGIEEKNQKENQETIIIPEQSLMR